MEVEIVCRETIKPSSPTPTHLGSYKLSLLDQIHLCHRMFVPVVLFYSPTHQNPSTTSALLKHSLSKTLAHFYPFAGRINADNFTVDCNDEGVVYVEARVSSDISVVVKEPEIDHLLQLVPAPKSPEDDGVLLAVQVNYFACGGMAICASISHVVADASAIASFVKSWAEVARGADQIGDGAVYDCTSLFPPQDLSDYWKVVSENMSMQPQGSLVSKRFVFEGSKIAALRNEMAIIGHHPSRFEAVSALLWLAMMATTMKDSNQSFATAAVTVNLRKRMNPPLPEKCIGNVIQLTVSEPVEVEKHMNINILARKVHESIKKVSDEYVREVHARGEYLDVLLSTVEGFNKSRMFGFTGLCRFPFYDTDFGWGKPVWFGIALRFYRGAFFMDTKDGDGIEAWVTLAQEDMAILEQHPLILAHASFKPSILEK